LIKKLTNLGGWSEAVCQERQNCIDQICAVFTVSLREVGLSDSEDSSLTAHGQAVQVTVQDPLLSRLSPQVG
jgi:hypothetical protein